MTALLELKQVSKTFGGVRALNNVTLNLYEGEIVGLIGPNGAGKTTLVNVITGVTRATSGKVLFCGNDVTDQRPHQAARRGLCRTFQIVQPFPRMSVLNNVAAGALFGNVDSKGDVKLAEEIAREQLEFTGLGSNIDRPASSLTIAGRKRLELAKSLAMRPKVLILDEVNAGLNANEIDGALVLIRKVAERGVTILLIEHLMKVVLSLSQRVLVLHHGELIAQGAPATLVNDARVIEAYLGHKFLHRHRQHGTHA